MKILTREVLCTVRTALVVLVPLISSNGICEDLGDSVQLSEPGGPNLIAIESLDLKQA